MNCQEASEFISAAIDGELSTELKLQLLQHVGDCPPCRRDYDLEQATKFFIKNRIKRTSTPQTLKEQIRKDLTRQFPLDSSRETVLSKLFKPPSWRALLALGGSFAIIILIVLSQSSPSHHSHAQPVDGSVIHQTFNNFDNVLDRKLKPAIRTDDPVLLKKFFTSRVNFHVNIIHSKDLVFVGGTCTKYMNNQIAHLIYKHKNDIIYLYQAKLQDVLAGGSLHIPQKAWNELQQTGWYFENHDTNCSFAMWIVDSTICSAIADITKDKLRAILSSNR